MDIFDKRVEWATYGLIGIWWVAVLAPAVKNNWDVIQPGVERIDRSISSFLDSSQLSSFLK